MKRRAFLSMLGVAPVAAMLPWRQALAAVPPSQVAARYATWTGIIRTITGSAKVTDS
jgi:hypothetical protein